MGRGELDNASINNFFFHVSITIILARVGGKLDDEIFKRYIL